MNTFIKQLLLVAFLGWSICVSSAQRLTPISIAVMQMPRVALTNSSGGGGGGGTPALIANTAGGTTSAAINTTGATLLIAVISDNATISGSPTDSKGNTWTALTVSDGAGMGVYVRAYYCSTPVIGTGHTLTSNGGGFSVVGFYAFSGTSASAFDVENGVSYSVSTTTPVGSVTPSQTGELMFAVSVSTQDLSGSTIDTAYNIIDSGSGAAGVCNFTTAWFVTSGGGALNPTFTAPGLRQLFGRQQSFKHL